MSRIIFGLISDVQMATRIAKSAKNCHVEVYNSDRAANLAKKSAENQPFLIVLDWDGCEAESFRWLDEMKKNEVLRTVPVIGYCLGARQDLVRVAQKSGCHRVYGKSEFLRDLDLLIARYAV